MKAKGEKGKRGGGRKHWCYFGGGVGKVFGAHQDGGAQFPASRGRPG